MIHWLGNDNTNENRFIYGGWPGTVNSETLSDLGIVYILTLPAFEWMQVPGSVTQRDMHRCELIGNRQMLSIGGIIQNDATITDPWANGLGIFDITDLVWKFNFSANAAAYVPSKLVANYYSAAGSRYPSTWADPALATIFNEASTTGGSISPTSSTPPTSPTASSSAQPHSNIGTIAGGTVGGVAGAAIIAGFAFLFWRRRDRKPDDSQPYTERDSQNYNHPSEMDTGMVPEMEGSKRVLEMDSSQGPRLAGNRLSVTQTYPVELQAYEEAR